MTDFDRTFDVLDELRQQMDRVWNDYDGSWGVTRSPTQTLTSASWPRFNVLDAGANLLVTRSGMRRCGIRCAHPNEIPVMLATALSRDRGGGSRHSGSPRRTSLPSA